MRTILLIIKREYLSRIRKKSFIIGTLLVPFAFIALFLFQILLITNNGATSAPTRIAILDETTLFDGKIKDNKNIFLKKSPNLTIKEIENTYKLLHFDGVLYIPKSLDINKPNGIQYISDKLLGTAAKIHIQNEIEKEIKNIKLQNLGITPEQLSQIRPYVYVQELDTKGTAVGGTGAATAIGGFMGFLMYLILFIYGAMVMRGVIEEKNNRVVEVILSSVRPFKLMLGKIIGIGLVGLTQFGIWIVTILLLSLITNLILVGSGVVDMQTLNQHASSNQQLLEALQHSNNTAITQGYQQTLTNFQNLPLTLILGCFIFYFITGYILYGALFAGVGSAVNEDTDAQSLTFPITVPIIMAFIILTAVIENPNSNLAKWSSYIPLFAPIIMPARIAFGVSPLEIAISMACMLLGTLLAVFIAAKIYRMGILMYGKKITLKELVKWIRYA